MYLLAFAAQAKQGTVSRATVEGTVFLRDSAGNESPVAAARVTLEGPATLQAETDSNGEYSIAAVPFGTYTVQVVFPGLEARETIQITSTEVRLPLEAKPVAVTTSVVVTADGLRCSQLDEALDDARQYNGDTPILFTGDLNLDASREPAAAAIRHAQFRDEFADRRLATTPDTFLENGRAIDWIFTRGPLRASQPQVHRSVSASDHFPLSITLAFA
jgi:hypothetical protein